MNKLDHRKGSRPRAGFRSVVNSLRPGGVRFRLDTMPVMIPLLAGLYVVAANLTLWVGDFSHGMAVVRPQTGIALAVLVGLGLRYWPGIVGGALVVEVVAAGFSVQAMVLTMGDTLEAVFGAGLVRRFANGARAFEQIQDGLKFSLLGALGSTSVGALVATTGFCWPEAAPCHGAGSFWVSWWLGSALGALVAGPLLICWIRQPTFGWLRARKLEAAMLVLAVAVVSKVVFGDG
ncbi:MAG: MASE1 domain-containing protein, partial [Nitrospirales bacterium]